MFYLEQWWIPIIVGGISWVSLAFTWALSRHTEVYSKALTNFYTGSTHPEEMLESFFSQIYDDSRIVLSTIPWAVTITLYILLARQGVVSVPQKITENILSHTPLLAYSITLAFIAAYHVGMGSYLVARHTLFIRRLSRFPLKTTPLEIRRGTALQGLGRFSFLGSITWFVGVGMGVLVVRSIVDMVTVSVLIVLTSIGMLILLSPQICLRRSIRRYKDEVQSQIVKKFQPKWKCLDKNLGKLDLITLCELYDQIESIEEWPFGKERTIKEALASLIPLASSIVALILR